MHVHGLLYSPHSALLALSLHRAPMAYRATQQALPRAVPITRLPTVGPRHRRPSVALAWWGIVRVPTVAWPRPWDHWPTGYGDKHTSDIS